MIPDVVYVVLLVAVILALPFAWAHDRRHAEGQRHTRH